jgi:hypothetical protein
MLPRDLVRAGRGVENHPAVILALVRRLIGLLDLSGFDMGASLGGIAARDPSVPGRLLRTPPGVQEDDDVRWNFRAAAPRETSVAKPARRR